MGHISTVNKLPENLRNKVVGMLNNPATPQREIVAVINAEAGYNILSKSALCRFVKDREKITGAKRGKKPSTAGESLARIATALDRIAFSLENHYKKSS